MRLLLNFQSVLARNMERCYGVESQAAKFVQCDLFRSLDVAGDGLKSNRVLIGWSPLEGNAEARREFVEDANKMLRWAGLEAVTEKEIL